MRRSPDPLADIDSLVRDVYAYVAYRVPNRSEAEDVTSAVFERAVRYRNSYDASKGSPIEWMIGIARTQILEERARRSHAELGPAEIEDGTDIEASTLERLSLQDAVHGLDDRSRELIALRYGIGMPTREIAAHMGLEESAVNVALHRARERLRTIMTNGGSSEGKPGDRPV